MDGNQHQQEEDIRRDQQSLGFHQFQQVQGRSGNGGMFYHHMQGQGSTSFVPNPPPGFAFPVPPGASSSFYNIQDELNMNMGMNCQSQDQGSSFYATVNRNDVNINSKVTPGMFGAVGELPRSYEYSNVNANNKATPEATIKPLIDNIVGSMSFNGTYTHFGGTTATELGVDNVKMVERRQGQASPVGNNTSGRASTASDSPIEGTTTTTSSRPQTPSKPSFAEILAKNAAQNGAAVGSSYRQAVGSGGNNKPKEATSAGTKGSGSSGSGNSSACASSSSSPVTKPKSFSQSIMGRLFTSAGKENNSNSSSKSSSSSRTPQGTPTHQKKPDIKSEDRKVLTTQNSASSSKTKSKKFPKGFTAAGDFSELNLDELEANDDDDDDEGWEISPSKNKRNNDVVRKSSNDEERQSKTMGTDEGNGRESGLARRDSLTDKKTSLGTTSTTASSRKFRGEKERGRGRRDDRNCLVRRMEKLMYLWAATLISALAWLLKLVTDVFSLSVSVGTTLMEDFCSWWTNNAVPNFCHQLHAIRDAWSICYRKLREILHWRNLFFWRQEDKEAQDYKRNSEELLAALGPEKNIQITTSEETMKRLLSCKGQDPYSILGVRSDSSDEAIRRYYKKQAVQVHPDKNPVPGAEEAFKILQRAFELIGEPSKRQEYHHQLLEAHAKEQVFGEIGKLLEQLRKKMEQAASSIRCTKCNQRHKKNKTGRPLFAARYCAQCKIHHAAREGELWAETKGWFGLSWNYYTCMDSVIWEINEWAKCQKKNLLHIKADSHCVMYRLVAGGGNNQQQTNGHHRHDSQFHIDAEDDWDSLINNLYKAGGKQPNDFYSGGTGTGSAGPSNANGTTNGGRKRKGKRK